MVSFFIALHINRWSGGPILTRGQRVRVCACMELYIENKGMGIL